jgi:hypothetical protein
MKNRHSFTQTNCTNKGRHKPHREEEKPGVAMSLFFMNDVANTKNDVMMMLCMFCEDRRNNHASLST